MSAAIKATVDKAAAQQGKVAHLDSSVTHAPRTDASSWSGEFQLSSGGAGDHGPAWFLLQSVFGGPTREQFFATLDDPFYEPHDRVVVRQGMRVVSHAQYVPRTIRFGGLEFPIGVLCAVATSKEHQGKGFASAVLAKAEAGMLAEGAVLGMLRTNAPHFFRRDDWVVGGRHSHARVRTRQLLAQLSSRGVPALEDCPHIRPLRQVELPSLMRVYEAATAQAHGAYQRTEAYWRWLISRQGVDHIFVALGGDDRRAWDSFDSPVVGYVIVKDDQILELMTLPGAIAGDPPADVAEQLLARACGEALERDFQDIQLHAAADQPLFNLFRAAGGAIVAGELDQGDVLMIKLFDPHAFVARLAPELQRRASERLDDAKVELFLQVDEDRYRLQVSKRSVQFGATKTLGRNYLRMGEAEFIRMLIGHAPLAEAVRQKRIHASTRLALQTADALFPALPLWHSPWDELYV